MKTRSSDQIGVLASVYVPHLEPGYRHARHYIGWTAGDGCPAVHLQGHRSPLIRAPPAGGARVAIAAVYPGRVLERCLKRWLKTSPVLFRLPRASGR
jgi:hypothetical protein